MIYKGKGGKQYNLEQAPFAQGGEGKVYNIVGNAKIVAKLYKNNLNTVEKERKLVTMVDNPPDQAVMTQISWPLDVLYDNNNSFVGFIMPKLNINEDLNVIYEYGSSAKYPNIPWTNKIVIAKNLCAVLDAVHSAGHVVGDLNPKNISVDPNTGHIVFVDTDSYHIEENGNVYRCNVGMPEYLPVEIQRKMQGGLSNAQLPTFTQHTDDFALAVHIFQLLMNGTHPFACRILPSQASVVFPQPTDNILNGVFPFMQPTAGIAIPVYAPPIDILPKEMQKLFERAFITGHSDPQIRPNAEEWYNALCKLEKELVVCKKVSHHEYHKDVKKCPWCSADQNFNNGVVSAKKTPMVQSTIRQSMKPAYQSIPTTQQNATTNKRNARSGYKGARARSGISIDAIQVAIFITSILSVIAGVLLLKTPQLIFGVIHWGWVLGIGIVLFVGMIIWSLIMLGGGLDNKLVATQIISACCMLALMIFGLCYAHVHTYELSSPDDFNLLENLPGKDEKFYRFEVKNDIDFAGYSLDKSYGDRDVNVIINGNGYKIKNIRYSATLEESTTFLVLGYGCQVKGSNSTVPSQIKDLVFENCEFEITPNSYDDRDHEGNEINFSIMSSAALEDVNMSATVYINKAEENMRYNSLSTIGKVLPENKSENGSVINILVRREE